jgi:hypothetical protein
MYGSAIPRHPIAHCAYEDSATGRKLGHGVYERSALASAAGADTTGL